MGQVTRLKHSQQGVLFTKNTPKSSVSPVDKTYRNGVLDEVCPCHLTALRCNVPCLCHLFMPMFNFKFVDMGQYVDILC